MTCPRRPHHAFAYLVPQHAVLPHGMSQHQVGKGIVATLIAAALVGCAERSSDAGGDVESSSQYDVATGAADILVSIDVSGGYQPSDLRDTAEFLLLGDGTAISAGVVDTVFPGPAIRPLQSAVVPAVDIQQLFGRADDSGFLVDGIDFGEPTLQDLPYTTVSLTVSGRTVTHSVYALGFNDDADADLDEDQRALRRDLLDFIAAAQANVAADSPRYVPTAVVAYVLDIETTLGGPENGTEPVPWPISTLPPPIVAGAPTSCVLITGGEVPVLLDALADATQVTFWQIRTGPPDQMIFRPQVPGDEGCAA